jgi:transposase
MYPSDLSDAQWALIAPHAVPPSPHVNMIENRP